MAQLVDLPPELLNEIMVHVESLWTLSQLSQTCKKMHDAVGKDGFRIFVKSRFPSVPMPCPRENEVYEDIKSTSSTSICRDKRSQLFWRHAAQALTTLSRNWDRKAFLAHYMRSATFIEQSPTNEQWPRRNIRRQGQSMGFVPIIDSHEIWYGGDWDSRREVVAWGAGASLVMRVKAMGQEAEDVLQMVPKHFRETDAHGHAYRWTKFQQNGAVEGLDDITALKLLPHQSLENTERVIIGRAQGDLSKVSLRPGTVDTAPLAMYVTDGQWIKSATLNPGTNDLLAVLVSPSKVALFPTLPDGLVYRSGEVDVIPAGYEATAWSTQFLNVSRLAVGLGFVDEPVRVYDIGRGELDAKAVRNISLQSSGKMSVCSLAPLTPSSSAGGTEGDLFLSGARDGLIRLHDLRCSNSVISTFTDQYDQSAVYSLLPFGRERFVAGGAQNSLIKVFDLRIPGGKTYYAADLEPCSENLRENSVERGRNQGALCDYHYDARYHPHSYSIFLDQRNGASPVYSLASPSHYSPTFFAGIEDNVVQMDLVSIMDKYPDPIHRTGVQVKRPKDVYPKWYIGNRALKLALYQNDGQQVNLMSQGGSFEHARSKVKGLDGRWHSVRGT